MGMIDHWWPGAVGPAQPPVDDLGAQFAAGFHAVIGAAGEEQLVRIGVAAARPAGLMVDLTPIAGLKAVGTGAAAVAGVTDQPLVSGRDSLLPP